MRDSWQSSQGKAVRLRCFERDRKADARCWLCGLPIDYSLGPAKRTGTPDAWEGDHKKPRDKYPELALDPANILPAHSHCNRSRGKKAGLSELGKPTRDWFSLR